MESQYIPKSKKPGEQRDIYGAKISRRTPSRVAFSTIIRYQRAYPPFSAGYFAESFYKLLGLISSLSALETMGIQCVKSGHRCVDARLKPENFCRAKVNLWYKLLDSTIAVYENESTSMYLNFLRFLPIPIEVLFNSCNLNHQVCLYILAWYWIDCRHSHVPSSSPCILQTINSVNYS